MYASTRTNRIAAALLALASAAAVAAPAHAEEAKPNPQVEVDTRTTGSIPFLKPACDPNAANAGVVCRVTKGQPEARFPSAPVNPSFGF